MIRPARSATSRRSAALVATVAIATSLFAGVASAQERFAPPAESSRPGGVVTNSPLVAAPPRLLPMAGPIRAAVRTADYGGLRPELRAAPPQSASSGRGRSVGRRILGGALGATAGFFAGGYLGAVIEGDRCHCDDPGLKGILIGAPIGAVTGGILGALFF